MKGLMILANGFEDTEALATLDVLRRAKLEVDTVSVTETKRILTQTNIYIETDKLLSEVDYSSYDFLVVPGGKAVFSVLDKIDEVSNVITHFVNENKLATFICAAPHLVGKLGLLKDKNYTCFPNCNDRIIGGTYLNNSSLVVDKNIITCRSMAYSIDFGLAIIEHLLGKNQKEIVERSIKGLA